MRTRQKRVAADTWRSLGCRTTPLEHWSRRKPTVEPRWAKQQTKKLRPKPNKIYSFMSGPLSLTPDPPGVQLKREAKLLTVTGLNTKHVDCRIIFMLYPIRLLIVSVYITHKTIFQIVLNVTWRRVKYSHRNCNGLSLISLFSSQIYRQCCKNA